MKRILILALLSAAAIRGVSAADFDMDGSGGKTTILSETLEMVSTDEENVFYFTKNVRANGTNLSMTADQIVVRALREPAEEGKKEELAGLGSIGTIKNIVATGNVLIEQDGRKATSGKAEFFPKDGKVVLTDNPTVIDSKAIVSGWRITLVQGERRVMVEQDPNGTQRPSVNLSQIPDMGFDEQSETDEVESAPEAMESENTLEETP